MNRKTQLLGIDVGTSGLKAVLLDSAGARPDGTVQVHLATSTHLHRGRDQVEGAQVCSLT